ncbi:MAG: DUF937 domain-containing protein [Thermoanaerobaculia bacterium]
MEQDAILNTLSRALTPATIQQISSSIGASPTATSQAVNLALPALLGGLSRNASNPQGAQELDRALNAHDGGILDNLGGLLGGAAGAGIGGAILGHIFGARRSPVEQGVGKATGLNAQQVAQLLAMLAPIVMGVLGRMKQQKGIDASKLPDVLKQTTNQLEKQVPGAGGFASMLDSNNDGQIADDLARMGGSVLGGFFKK